MKKNYNKNVANKGEDMSKGGGEYVGDSVGFLNFADAIKEEDAIVEGYKNGVESFKGVKFKGGRVKEFYLSPISSDFGIFTKLVKIANGSFTVDAVADDKKMMIAGNPLIFKRGKNRKFSFRLVKKLVDIPEAELDEIEERLSDLGDVGNIRDLGEGVIEDLIKIGNCFIQIRRFKKKDGKGYDLYFSLLPVHECRLKMRSLWDEEKRRYDVDTTEPYMVGICGDWGRANKMIARSEVWDIPLLGKALEGEGDWLGVKFGDIEYEVTCIHLKFRKTGFRFYGMPRWIPAYWYAVIENVFGRLNATKMKNNSMASGVLQLFANSSISKNRAKELKDEVETNFNNLDAVGRILVQVLTDKNLAANFVSFDKEGGKKGDYAELLSICSKALITAMKTFPDLAGIATAGELGGTDKVKSNYIITQSRDITPNQDFIIEKVYLKIFELLEEYEGGVFKDLNCEYSNAVPVLLFGDINLENVLDRDELRAELGFPLQGKEYSKNSIVEPVNKDKNGIN